MGIGCAGLDFSSSQLSLPLSISGVALMVWSLVFFPMVQRCLGARTCAVFGLAATVFLSVALGCTSYLAQAHASVSGIIVALTVIMVLKACFQQLCFPTSMVRRSFSEALKVLVALSHLSMALGRTFHQADAHASLSGMAIALRLDVMLMARLQGCAA